MVDGGILVYVFPLFHIKKKGKNVNEKMGVWGYLFFLSRIISLIALIATSCDLQRR